MLIITDLFLLPAGGVCFRWMYKDKSSKDKVLITIGLLQKESKKQDENMPSSGFKKRSKPQNIQSNKSKDESILGFIEWNRIEVAIINSTMITILAMMAA